VSASGANDYINGYGINFGYRTNDRDNSAGSSAIANSPLFYGVPWIAVIDASTMQFVEHDANSWTFDIMTHVRNLAD